MITVFMGMLVLQWCTSLVGNTASVEVDNERRRHRP